jgi:hypothetical protein
MGEKKWEADVTFERVLKLLQTQQLAPFAAQTWFKQLN